MLNYTQIILSFLLLLSNTASSPVLMIANELELSATFFRGTATNSHGNRKLKSPPPGRESIRNYYQLINIIPAFGLDNQDIIPYPARRGSGR